MSVMRYYSIERHPGVVAIVVIWRRGMLRGCVHDIVLHLLRKWRRRRMLRKTKRKSWRKWKWLAMDKNDPREENVGRRRRATLLLPQSEVVEEVSMMTLRPYGPLNGHVSITNVMSMASQRKMLPWAMPHPGHYPLDLRPLLLR
jgi:hypothetical protein